MVLLGLCAWLALGLAGPAGATFDHSQVGVYGTLFDFCDYSVYKVFWHGDRRPSDEQVRRVNQALAAARAAGKKNLLLFYPFDRVSHSAPLETYLANTDEGLAKLDLTCVDALCLAEENVTWNHGLAILNALYDRVKAKWDGPVYQWLTMPDPPHPDLRADGWIIDPYGFDRARFRRYLAKFLATGKPVINCVTASPDPHAPWDRTAIEQTEVCREFAVPMFFYCVDRKWGSPDIWLWSTDPDIVAPRDWLMGLVSRLHEMARPVRPLESAAYLSGRVVEVCGGVDHTFAFTEEFSDSGFLDDLSCRGFGALTWTAGHLWCRPAVAGGRVTLQYEFASPFALRAIAAGITGEQRNGARTTLALSLNGHAFGDARTQQDDGPFEFEVAPEKLPDEPLQQVWVRVNVAGPPESAAVLTRLFLRGETIPPERREWRLSPAGLDVPAGIEDFQTPRYLHLAEVDGDPPLWTRGALAARGIQGRGRRSVVRYRLAAEAPLAEVRVRVEQRANGRNLGAANQVRLLLGESVLAEAQTTGPGNASGWVDDPLEVTSGTLPPDTRELTLELVMTNGSGVETNTSNLITRVTIYALAQLPPQPR